jgi:hypothetical protein
MFKSNYDGAAVAGLHPCGIEAAGPAFRRKSACANVNVRHREGFYTRPERLLFMVEMQPPRRSRRGLAMRTRNLPSDLRANGLAPN